MLLLRRAVFSRKSPRLSAHLRLASEPAQDRLDRAPAIAVNEKAPMKKIIAWASSYLSGRGLQPSPGSGPRGRRAPTSRRSRPPTAPSMSARCLPEFRHRRFSPSGSCHVHECDDRERRYHCPGQRHQGLAEVYRPTHVLSRAVPASVDEPSPAAAAESISRCAQASVRLEGWRLGRASCGDRAGVERRRAR